MSIYFPQVNGFESSESLNPRNISLGSWLNLPAHKVTISFRYDNDNGGASKPCFKNLGISQIWQVFEWFDCLLKWSKAVSWPKNSVFCRNSPGQFPSSLSVFCGTTDATGVATFCAARNPEILQIFSRIFTDSCGFYGSLRPTKCHFIKNYSKHNSRFELFLVTGF